MYTFASSAHWFLFLLWGQPCLGERKKDRKTGEYGDYTWMTWGAALARVEAIGAGLAALRDAAGARLLPAQSTVGLFAPNSPAWALCEYASYTQRLAVVPLYPTCGAGTIRYIVAHAGLRAVFCAAPLLATLLDDIRRGTATPHALPVVLTTVIVLGVQEDEEEEAVEEEKEETEGDGVKGKKDAGLLGVLDALSAENRETLESLHIRVMTLEELVEHGKEEQEEEGSKEDESKDENRKEQEKEWAKPDDVLSIVYTSGSEGTPKGVVLAHRALAAAMDVFLASPAWEDDLRGWTYYSYLPLAHVFERQLSTLFLVAGARIAYTSGLARLAADLARARPHLLIGVPRVWKRLHDSITAAAAQQPLAARTLFRLALARRTAALRSGRAPWLAWDRAVLDRAAAALGGRLRVAINGGAAADPALSLWCAAVLGVRFYQGYGLSETFGAVTMQLPCCCADLGTIGPLAPHIRARLADVPDMGYTSTDSPCPRGELCLSGPSVTRGYYRGCSSASSSSSSAADGGDGDESTTSTTTTTTTATAASATAATKVTEASVDSALDADGFFATGDIAQLNADGSLTIIDRKKNMFKLAQGEYVALEYIETVYSRAPDVAQIWVWGDPLSSFLVAVVVPHTDRVLPRARAAVAAAASASPATPTDASSAAPADGTEPLTDEEVLGHAETATMLLAALNSAADAAHLLSYQRAKAVLVEPHAWTVESGLLTPTFKLRRTQLLAHYRAPLTALCHAYQAQLDQRDAASAAPSAAPTEHK